MGYGSSNSFALNNNPNRQAVGAGTKLPPPKGYSRIWIDVTSTAGKDKTGQVHPNDAEIEKAVFARFGLAAETDGDLSRLRERLGTTDNPFDFVKTTGNFTAPFRASGKYKIPVDVENSLYAKLSGKAAQVTRQIETETRAQRRTSNANETVAAKNGYDAARQQQAKLNRLIRDAQVQTTSFGIPSKLTDINHVVVTLPVGSAPTADNALSAYIEKRYGGGNLYGRDKLDILNAAKQSGVKVENLQVSPKNRHVVEFDLSLEGVLKLQKAYLDVQEKVNTNVALADKVRDEMALNQFLLGVINGAVDDVKGNINTITHPLETLQGIRDAVNILSQLSAQDVKNIVAELGSKATNATPGEAAHAAGYVVGTIAVEAVLAKGAGAALSALGKTKAGAEFLARIGKLAERTGELANLGKAKIAEMFSDEAATLAKQNIRRMMANPAFYSGLPAADFLKEAGVFAGNKLKNGATTFKQFMAEATKEFGDGVKGRVGELAAAYREAMQKSGFGSEIIELDIEQTSKMAKMQFERESGAARQKLLSGIQKAENEGKLRQMQTDFPEDYGWLQENPRHKELAFDPDNNQFKVKEARAILDAEKQGILKGPVSRGIYADGRTHGADYFDGNGIAWDMKEARGGAKKILGALADGENVIVDAKGLSETEFKVLKAEIAAKRPNNNNKVVYVR